LEFFYLLAAHISFINTPPYQKQHTLFGEPRSASPHWEEVENQVGSATPYHSTTLSANK
jgi:hypothetical protein